nr:MAG TPA: hypothetical protein [Caudoviricetes sp.]
MGSCRELHRNRQTWGCCGGARCGRVPKLPPSRAPGVWLHPVWGAVQP